MNIDYIKNVILTQIVPLFSQKGFEKHIKPVLNKQGFERYFVNLIKNLYTDINFGNRCSRAQYWYFSLFVFLVGLVITILDHLFFAGFLGIVFSLAMLLPMIELSVRRIHDLGQPWFWILIGVVPVVGALALLIWFAMPGEEKNNQWGAPAK